MGFGVDRWSTKIDPNMAGRNWFEYFFGAALGVVKDQTQDNSFNSGAANPNMQKIPCWQGLIRNQDSP